MALLISGGRGRTGFKAVGLLIALLGLTAPADAAGRRARLSADLADQLAAGSSVIDVIVHGTRAEVDALAQKYNVRVKKYLRSGGVLTVTAGQLAALQEDEALDHLSADVPIRSSADVTALTIGADQVWSGSETLPALTGDGVGVAVIDSGVDARHAALRGRVVYSMDFTGGDGVDRYGHGTHVAAIIAGADRSSSADGVDFRGIASGARIINLRVLGDTGAGMASDVVEAIDWAVENRHRYGIQVINLSLGAPVTQPYRDDPLCEAVERASAAGLIVVVAAGNNGLNAEGQTVYGSIATPGNDPSVITVGALDAHDTAARADDTVARFSSRGPTRFDLVLKPDLVAPGSRVVSAEAPGSYLAQTYPQRHVGGSGDHGYLQLSGTSMAAGVVSGTVALLLEENRKLPSRLAKGILQITSTFLPLDGIVGGGAGSLDAVSALTLVVSMKPSLQPASPMGNRIAALNSIVSDTTLVWGLGRDTIVWGTGGDTIVWGTNHTIVWGTGATIVWGTNGDTIVWGTSADTIVWGTSTWDTIVWGTSVVDTIVWGTFADSPDSAPIESLETLD